MSLQQRLLSWDGKSAADIGEVYQQYGGDAGFLSELLKMMTEPSLQKGASWLLKATLDDGGLIERESLNKLLSLLPQLQHWESKLHILQSFSHFLIPTKYQTTCEIFIRSGLEDQHKFVRAWAYDGFYQLARQYPQYQTEAMQLFDIALRDEPASVKARVRHIVKVGFA